MGHALDDAINAQTGSAVAAHFAAAASANAVRDKVVAASAVADAAVASAVVVVADAVAVARVNADDDAVPEAEVLLDAQNQSWIDFQICGEQNPALVLQMVHLNTCFDVKKDVSEAAAFETDEETYDLEHQCG